MSAIEPAVTERGCVDEAVTVCGSEVVCQKTAWLWPGRVPLGKLTLLVGDPEQGKSFLTIDMAARVTRGRAWPDGAKRPPRGSVLILAAEDHAEDTVVPRLKKAGATLAKCSILKGTRGEDGLARPLSLDRDLSVLRRVLLKMPDCRLVVIDPISAYLGNIDGNNNSQLRSILFPLSQLAAEQKVAVVLVNHLNKRSGRKALYRAMGSMAFVAVARAAWLVARDPNDDGRRYMLSLKSNLTNAPKGMAFRLSASNKQAIAKIAWEREPVEQSLAEALQLSSGFNLAEQTYRDHENWVVTWLREQLSDGPKTRMTLWLDGILERVSKDQLYRAGRRLGVVIQKKGMTWESAEWMLPEHVGRRFSNTNAEPTEADVSESGAKDLPTAKEPAKASTVPLTSKTAAAEVLDDMQRELAATTEPARRKQILFEARRGLEGILGTSKEYWVNGTD